MIIIGNIFLLLRIFEFGVVSSCLIGCLQVDSLEVDFFWKDIKHTVWDYGNDRALGLTVFHLHFLRHSGRPSR